MSNYDYLLSLMSQGNYSLVYKGGLDGTLRSKSNHNYSLLIANYSLIQ